MRPTGPRSPIEATTKRCAGGPPRPPVVACVGLLALTLLGASAAAAFDVFTLWQQRELDLDVAVGDWIEVRTSTVEAGRRTFSLSRLQCVSEDERGWRLEMLPLDEPEEGVRVIAPGEGWSFVLDRAVTAREGDLFDHVRGVRRWEGGRARDVDAEEWRSDPLLATALSGGFAPDERREGRETTRVVGGRDLVCPALVYVETDEETIELPSGRMIQTYTREVSVARHPDVPFLGVVYAAERAVTESRLDPPGRRSPPPPQIRVETMELMDFGDDATAVLDGGT